MHKLSSLVTHCNSVTMRHATGTGMFALTLRKWWNFIPNVRLVFANEVDNNCFLLLFLTIYFHGTFCEIKQVFTLYKFSEKINWTLWSDTSISRFFIACSFYSFVSLRNSLPVKCLSLFNDWKLEQMIKIHFPKTALHLSVLHQINDTFIVLDYIAGKW